MVLIDRMPELPLPQTVSKRLLALDGLRGLTVLLMLLVNNVALDAATPDQLTHAPFGGINLTDLVFPWFLFCMGAAIPYAAASFTKQKLSSLARLRKIFTRSASLFAIGLFLTCTLSHTLIFALGVLQLIALAYGVAALLYMLSSKPLHLLLMAAALLVGYWAAIRFVPVPGVGPGIFEEDRNLLLHLNQTYLEPLGLRGLLSVIPTTALALLGAIVAQTLRRPMGLGGWWQRPLNQLWVMGSVWTLVGYLWSLDLPFSKTYWTPPYILFSAGLATLLIGVFYWLFDLKGWQGLAFGLLVPGSNALLAYVAPILFKVWVLQGWYIGKLSLQQAWLNWHIAESGPVLGGWIYTLLYIAFWWAVLWVCWHKGWFWRV